MKKFIIVALFLGSIILLGLSPVVEGVNQGLEVPRTFKPFTPISHSPTPTIEPTRTNLGPTLPEPVITPQVTE